MVTNMNELLATKEESFFFLLFRARPRKCKELNAMTNIGRNLIACLNLKTPTESSSGEVNQNGDTKLNKEEYVIKRIVSHER